MSASRAEPTRAAIIVSEAGWQITLNRDLVMIDSGRVYCAERDPSGTLRDTGRCLLKEPFGVGELGMALMLLAESLDDVSDALWRRAQGGE